MFEQFYQKPVVEKKSETAEEISKKAEEMFGVDISDAGAVMKLGLSFMGRDTEKLAALSNMQMDYTKAGGKPKEENLEAIEKELPNLGSDNSFQQAA